jgi:DNA-binding response OmpR family regulator
MARRNSANTKKILVVDDDHKTVDLVHLYLENEDYDVARAYDGQTALLLARKHQPDLILLDLMLPYLDGLDICETLRKESSVPVIMVTARSTEDDKLIGLELGADDYITKPFSPRELVARVKAVLRRTNGDRKNGPATQKIGALVIDFDRHMAMVQGRPVLLTPREFRLLATLASYPGRVFSRQELLEQAFGMDFDGLERTVDVHMMNLRRKIELDPSNPVYIQTVYGVGYRMLEGQYPAEEEVVAGGGPDV